MEKNKKKTKKKAPSSEEKVDYPRLPIEKAAELTERVAGDYGGIISYRELSKLGGAKGKTMGGTFGSITKSLKLYKLMDRYGLREMKVTEEGKMMTEIQDENKKKAFLFNLALKIPIIHELYQRYKDDIPKEMRSITDFLVGIKKLEKREAGRLANLYIKNHNFLGKINKDELKEIKNIEKFDSDSISSQESNVINEDLIYLLKLKYLYQPPKGKSKEAILNSVLEKFKNSGDVGIDSLIEGIKSTQNEEGKKALIDTLLLSFEKKYPVLKTSYEESTKKTEKKEAGVE